MSYGSVHLELPKNIGIELLTAPLVNGECRFSAVDEDGNGVDDTAGNTDDRGFINPVYTEPNTAWNPCIWVGKKIDEKLIADQTRSVAGYEITLQQIIGGTPVDINTKGRLQLKLKIGADTFETLEILAVINQTNIFWQIYAADIDE